MSTHLLTDRQQARQGFTIIETMLVLAITGVLIVGLLVGLGSSIGNQRYLDAVSSFKNLLQDQYSQINNVTNDRTVNWTCSSSAVPAVAPTGGTTPGQSNCVLLGRYLAVEGGTITMATVVGYPKSDTASSGTIASIKSDYTLGISTSSIESTSLEWGAHIAWPVSGGGSKPPTSPTSPIVPRSLAILLIRSPVNGTAYTFTSDSVSPITSVNSKVITDMMVSSLTASPGQVQRTVCLDPNGFSVPEKIAVYIGAGASGPSSIEIRSSALTVAAGGDSKC